MPASAETTTTTSTNLWKTLLKEAASARQSKLPAATVLFLGDAGAGKTRLVNRFCAAYEYDEEEGAAEAENDGPNGREAVGRPLLSYSFFDALDPAPDAPSSSASQQPQHGREAAGGGGSNEQNGNDDDDDDSAARVNVWSLSDPAYQHLLHVAFSQTATDKTERTKALQRTVCLLGVDLTRPWACEAALRRWTKVLQGVLADAASLEEEEDEETRQARLAAYLAKCYGGGSANAPAPHADDQDGASFIVRKSSPLKSGRRNSLSASSASSFLPTPALPDGVLATNLGIPLIVVGLKADQVKAPESFEEEQRSQYLQQFLRRFCLEHGAALVYASAARDTNRLLLQRYLLHRLYPELFPFSLQAQARREALFVPAGWDTSEIVRKLLSVANLPWAANASFAEVLPPPKGVRMIEDEEEEEEVEGVAVGKPTATKPSVPASRAWLEGLLQQQQQVAVEASPAAVSQSTTRRETRAGKVVDSGTGCGKTAAAAATTTGAGGGDRSQAARSFFEGLLATKK